MIPKGRIMRSRTARALYLLVFTIGLALPTALHAAPDAPAGLTCELLRRPERAVITDRQPEFGWIVKDPDRGAVQSAYRLIVATSRDNALAHNGDVWDTGRVTSSRSINVEYGGPALSPETRYWWTVKTWDASGQQSPWAEPQMFRTGDFDRKRKWPASSRWVQVRRNNGRMWALEDRQAMRFEEISPAEFVEKDKGHYFVDFGKDAYATLRLKVTLKEGSDDGELEVHLGEKLSGPRRVDRDPGATVRYRKKTLHLKPGTHTYTLDFPAHGHIKLHEHLHGVTPFRYCEIVGAPSSLQSEDITQLALFYPFNEDASYFNSSDETLNEVWDLCKYSMKATNAFGVYIDGDRERKPYEADAYINQLGYYCCDREYALSRYSHEYLIFHPTWPTEWILHSVLMARDDWMWTGNKESMRKYYDDLKAKTLSPLARDDGLLETGRIEDKKVLRSIHIGRPLRDIVDWPAGERDGYVFKPVNTVVNAFHYRALADMAKIADALGKSADEKHFRQQSERVRRSFNSKLFDEERGVYVDGPGTDHASLHANMFPLALGLVPEKRIESVVDFIKSKDMACSVYGAHYLLEALYDAGQPTHALELMTDKSTDRSWPHMVDDVGTTITLEAWDRKYKPNLDWNHAWGAAPANIIPRKLMGVEPLEPGFRKVRIRPQPADLQQASVTVPTIRGDIKVSYQQVDEAGYKVGVTIPANTSAEIHLQCPEDSRITENGNRLGRVAHAKEKGRRHGATIVATGSGQYNFNVELSTP